MSANEKDWVGWNRNSTSSLIEESLRAGLAVLWRAYIWAEHTGANVWDCAVGADSLYQTGMTAGDLRWLVTKGLAEHRQETSAYEAPRRSFSRSNGYFFNKSTCLVLTHSGAELAEHVFRETARLSPATLSTLATVANDTIAPANKSGGIHETTNLKSVKPRWNPVRRELSVSGLIVKRFRVPARNQETILSVFEEEGWIEHIHDPLPVNHDIDAPTRLHDAINRLNRCQINPVLRFHGDGKGTGVFWDLSQADLLG